MNNGTKHDILGQEFLSDLSNCTYYFPCSSLENRVKALHCGEAIVAFCLKELDSGVDVYITIPDKYQCIHYKNGTVTSTITSDNAHLTYHGSPKRKKVTGEIHISSSPGNPLKDRSGYTAAPTASSSNIELHPLPICRIELSESPGRIHPHSQVENFFETRLPNAFFNTIEVHLAKKGYANKIASASTCISPHWASIFIHTSMHAFFLQRIERRPGLYPMVLCLQTAQFEVIIMATHEFKNSAYDSNAIKYFYTKDYFRELGSRRVIERDGGFFTDQSLGNDNPEKGKYLSEYL